jgi:hypothetical protein
MIKGLYIGEDGTVQILGEVTAFTNIIKSIQAVLPQLEEQQRKLLTEDLTEEDLMRLLTEKKAAKDKAAVTGGSAAKAA